MERVDGRVVNEKVNHEVIVEEPGHQYVDHIATRSMGAADTAHELLDVIRENDAEPVVVGSDGTATNTGLTVA